MNNRIIGINVSDPTQNESSTKATMGSLIFSSNASNAAAFGKEKKRKENVYVCALPMMQKKRETSEISNPKEEQKSLTESFFDCATRWPLIDPFAVTRENNFVSTNIQIIKGTKIRLAFAFASRARRRVYDEERNISVKRLLVLFANKNRAHKKKRARCSKTAPQGKNATHLNRSRSSASQTYLRAGDFKRELFFVFAFVFLCGTYGTLCLTKESPLVCIYLVAQNACSFHLNFRKTKTVLKNFNSEHRNE